jgi:hypothetical protein
MFPISFPEYHRTQEAKEISPSHPAINLDGTGRAACGKAAHKPGIVFVQNHGEFLNDAEVVSCFWCFDMAKDSGFGPNPKVLLKNTVNISWVSYHVP